MVFASVTLKECELCPSAVHGDFENPMYESTVSESVQLSPVAPRTRSDELTLVAGRSADPDRD